MLTKTYETETNPEEKKLLFQVWGQALSTVAKDKLLILRA